MSSTRAPFEANSLHDRNTTLCLACACSLPPLKAGSSDKIHITDCCQSPICPSCISKNPRLARYNPCLSCLGGIDAVASGSGSAAAAPLKASLPSRTNIDGGARHEETFVLGDDEDEGDEEHDDGLESSDAEVGVNLSPPPYEAPPSIVDSTGDAQASSTEPPPNEERTKTAPYKYYINRTDTLQGISLRFGVDSHEICKMNNLPSSVMRTTPHLLHTRAFIFLPPTAKPHPSLTLSKSDQNKREEKLVRERAEKKLQKLTKEVDWRVARAYVAMADDPYDQALVSFKHKELGINGARFQPENCGISGTRGGRKISHSGLEALAVQSYLDDEEWEIEEIRAGRGVHVQRFPFGGFVRDGKAAQAAPPTGWRWW